MAGDIERQRHRRIQPETIAILLSSAVIFGFAALNSRTQSPLDQLSTAPTSTPEVTATPSAVILRRYPIENGECLESRRGSSSSTFCVLYTPTPILRNIRQV